jgi:hypothetical protein
VRLIAIVLTPPALKEKELQEAESKMEIKKEMKGVLMFKSSSVVHIRRY